MYRYSLILLIALLAMAFGTQAQQLAVKSFRSLPHDMDALQNYPLKDQNGEVCAIVKVQTLEKGFYFDIGTLGITKTVQKPGEIWVYMPHGARRLTITHELFVPLRDYIFPESIVEGACYELVLASGRSVTTIVPDEIETQWLIINSDPTGADVFIDDQPAGMTPYQSELPVGKHSYRIQKELYQNDAGMVELVSGQQKKKIESKLKPNFGTVQVTTTPESGATVKLNGMETGKTTPCTLERVPAGDHTISASLSMYATATQKVVVELGQTLPVSFDLKPSFAGITINTIPKADVYVNGQLKGNGQWQGRLNPGVYTFEAKLDKHTTATEKRTVVVGEPVELTLQPAPRNGNLKIISTPMDAAIKIGGKEYGTTPATLKNLLIGDYTVELSMAGFASEKQQVTLTEGETSLLNITLVKGESKPQGVATTPGTKPATQPVVTPISGGADADLAAYQAARQANTIESYQQYLTQYPNGRFRGEAQLFAGQLSNHTSPGGTTENAATGFVNNTETVNGVSFEMVAIKGGTFQMGSYDGEDDEKPVHSVTVSDFYMGETEVTVAQFESFIKATGNQTDAEKRTGGYGSYIWNGSKWEQKDGVTWRCDASGYQRQRSDYNHPVIHVSWNDAEAYCEWLSRITGKNYRLPTEAEWEYASGGGSNNRTKWAGTNSESSLGSYAWYNGNSNSQTHPVGTKSPNGLVLYDMSGNVWEWCSDWYKGYPGSNGITDYTGSSRVNRGGSWHDGPSNCRAADRYISTPDYRLSDLGFRVVLAP